MSLGRAFVVLCVVSFVVQWDFYCNMPTIFYRIVSLLQPDDLAEHGDNASDVQMKPASGVWYGWVISAFPIASLVLSLPMGVLSDKLGARVTVFVALLMMVAGNVIYILPIRSTWTLIGGRALAGAGSACRVACLAWVSKMYDGATRGARIGQWYSFGIIGMVIGPAAAATFDKVHFWWIHYDTAGAAISLVLEAILALVVLFQGALGAGSAPPPPLPPPSSGISPPEKQQAKNAENTPLLKDEKAASSKRFSTATDASDRKSGVKSSSHAFSNDRFSQPNLQEPSQPLLRDETSPPKRNTDQREETPVPIPQPQGPPAGKKGKLPRGLPILVILNFIFVLCITTFEATLVPLLHDRFNGTVYSTPLASNLMFVGIGVFVFFTAIVAGALGKCGVKNWSVMTIGSILFLLGGIGSYNFVHNIPIVPLLVIQAVSAVFCACGFTAAYVKCPDTFTGLIISTGDMSLIMKIGGLLGMLTVGGGLARAVGPLILGYGLHFGTNVVVGAICGLLTIALLILTFTRNLLLVRMPPGPPRPPQK